MKLTKQHRLAAMQIALGEKRYEEIALDLKIPPSTLDSWKSKPEFKALVQANLEAIQRKIETDGIGRQENRIKAVAHRHALLMQVILERGLAAPDYVPGGRTGLLVRNRHDEWKLDTGLLSELRALEMQVATELGQITHKSDVTSNGQTVALAFDITKLSDADIESRIKKTL